MVKDGRLKALAVTSRIRSALVPNLPRMSEAGVPGCQMIGWSGVFVAKGTSHAIVDRLRQHARRVRRLLQGPTSLDQSLGITACRAGALWAMDWPIARESARIRRGHCP